MEISCEFDVRFHAEVRRISLYNICHVYWMTLQNTHRRGRSYYLSTTDNLLDFSTNKAVSTDKKLLDLDETSSVAYNSGETQTYTELFSFTVWWP